MPVPPPPLNDYHPEIITGLTNLVKYTAGIILAMITTLYTLLRLTDSRQQDQLDDGAEAFSKNAIDIASNKQSIGEMKHDIKQITENVNKELGHLVFERNALVATTKEAIQKDIESLRVWIKILEDELDVFELKRMKDNEDRLKDHEALIRIKDHHLTNHGVEIK
jgi:hypothetical protein